MKNEKWFKDILAEVKFGEGFPMATFQYHPLYKVGVGKDTNLDYTFGKSRKVPWKNLRKFKYFKFEAPFPTDSVIFFQPGRKRLIISSQKEGKVLKISVSPEQLSLLQGEIRELTFQNGSEFAPHSVKLLGHGPNWIMTSFCSNIDSVAQMPILELHDLVMIPMVKFYKSHGVKRIFLSQWLIEAKRRAADHPSILLIEKIINELDTTPDFELINGQLHFDLHHGNVLRGDGQLAIIDWEVSHPGLLLVDYFDFYRRFVNRRKLPISRILRNINDTHFLDKFQNWLKLFDLTTAGTNPKVALYLYALERTLIYFEKWKEDRLKDETGFEYRITKFLI